VKSGAGPNSQNKEEAPEFVYGSTDEFLHEQLLPTCLGSATG
jgi:hypothetical protein